MMRSTYCCLIFLVGFIFIACTPVYIPNGRNATLFEKKGEYKAAVYLLQTADVQLAYAVSNHIGVMANGAMNVNSNFPRYRFGEMGIGYYTKIKDYHIEFFGGYGLGSSSGNFIDKSAEGDYYRVFCSQAVGQKLNRFQWSVINRASIIDFIRYQASPTIEQEKNTKVFIEPAAIASYNLAKEKLFFITQFGLSAHMGGPAYFDYQPLFFSIGLNYQFNKLKK
jgi:hypothetical protein